MKATEVKYFLMLSALEDHPASTQSELASSVDVPPSLVNRYLKRLSVWKAIENKRSGGGHKLTPKGEELVRQASWQFLDFTAEPLAQLRERAVSALRLEAERHKRRKVVLYGATPLASFLGTWAGEAGLKVVGVCDEERPGPGVLRLDDLAGLDFDCFLLSNWKKAEDPLLASLLAHYAPVINLFVCEGRATPDWR